MSSGYRNRRRMGWCVSGGGGGTHFRKERKGFESLIDG